MSTIDETKKAMVGAIEHFHKDLRGLRSGRASPSILEGIKVDAYGTVMSLRELGNITVSEGRQLIVTPFDPQLAGPIGKAIEKANIGLMPAVEGNVVRVPVPPLNEETRKAIVKQAREKVEEAKVSIREARRKGNDTARKDKGNGDITEDELKRVEKKIQELTDSYCKDIDSYFAEKEKDIMSI
tara:strand:- start:34 stop:585 length:552 start_codon:yes stop_codon:yes gene_type:complete